MYYNISKNWPLKRIAIGLMIAAFFALQYRLWVGEVSVSAWLSQQAELERMLMENERLYQRNRQLAAEVVDLQTGSDIIEEVARSELGLVREGETFYLTFD